MSAILIASKNSDKIGEMIQILNPTGIRIVSAIDYPDLPDVPETGTTLEENSILKAHAMYEYTGIASVADDTGLEVDALNGEPGVYSARYAGEGAGYRDNLNKLLAELSEIKTGNRKARFRTVIALKSRMGLTTFHGVCEGTILSEPAGVGGFGYDPVFRPDGHRETFAQMDAAVKNRISHRALALDKLKEFLLANPDYI